MSGTSDNSLAAKIKFAYALPAFALAVVGIPVYVYIPKFYTDVVGVHITLIGYLLFGVRLFDAFTDPLFGYLSDRTRSSFGRRRPYIVVGSLFVAATMYLLFNPPHAGPSYETIWFGVWIYALFLFWTAVVVPYESLGPEITFDYDERTSLFGLRDGFLIAGTLAAASSPAAVQAIFSLTADAAGEREKFFWISVIYAPLVIGSCWFCALGVRELPQAAGQRTDSLLAGVGRVFRNRPFVILLAAYTISAIGNNLPATLILYFVEYVLESDKADFFLLLYFVTGIAFLPGWIKLAHRTGKKAAWLGSMAVNTGAFIGVFFLGPGDTLAYGILVFLSGIGFGATLAIPSAIQADVIDYDELFTGQRREGQYIGLWSISKKMAAALGVGAGLTFLGLAGYQPNVEQSDAVRLTLRTLYALVPSLCNLVGFLIALAYPITGDIHRAIRRAIDDRRAGKEVFDPLNPGQRVDGY
jgi:GPH family glycoside/pentoside/hexuronide:cation symporter